MTDATNHSVVGTDGIVPSYNPEGLWKTWAISEIYLGEEGEKRYVPKINDHVIDPVKNIRWLVTELDQLTLIPTLEPLGNYNSIGLSSTDLLFATGPGWPSQNYRVYFDEGVYPYRLDTGCFLTIRTVNAAYVKFIYGPMYGDHDVISKVYDAAGNFVTDKVGLDLVEIEPGAGTNYHIKSIKPFNSTRKFMNGDTITALVYSQEGHLLGHTPLVVAESNMLRSQNAPIEYITSITLDSPYLSETDSNLLMLPLNWNKNSMNIEGVVNYSSGRKVKLPIDTRKFTLRGLGQLISSIPNQEYDMVLHYKLDVGEASIVENHIHNNGISQNIRVRIVNSNHSHSVKLFGYPYWDSSATTFRMRYWLFNLERNFFADVTSKVKIAANSPVFDGRLFGVVQRLQLTINLRDVFPTAKAFIHTQIMDVSLYGIPSDYHTPWVVRQDVNYPAVYGSGLFAASNGVTFKIDNDLELEDWINQVYKNTGPILETPENPNSAIKPSHFQLRVKNTMTEFPISSWNAEFPLPDDVQLYDEISLVFIRRISSGDLYLGASSLTLQNA